MSLYVVPIVFLVFQIYVSIAITYCLCSRKVNGLFKYLVAVSNTKRFPLNLMIITLKDFFFHQLM